MQSKKEAVYLSSSSRFLSSRSATTGNRPGNSCPSRRRGEPHFTQLVPKPLDKLLDFRMMLSPLPIKQAIAYHTCLGYPPIRGNVKTERYIAMSQARERSKDRRGSLFIVREERAYLSK